MFILFKLLDNSPICCFLDNNLFYSSINYNNLYKNNKVGKNKESLHTRMKIDKRTRSKSPLSHRNNGDSQGLSPAWDHVSRRYKVTKIAGKGSFGEIVKAKCLSTGRNVAIKRMCFVEDCHL